METILESTIALMEHKGKRNQTFSTLTDGRNKINKDFLNLQLRIEQCKEIN